MSTSRIVIVTGMSGAGRSSCLKILEDAGFEAVDNLPFQLLARLLRPHEPPERPLAVGIDSRTRGLVPSEFVREIERFRAEAATPLTLVFFECDDEVLQRRYTESRRRHPLAGDRPVTDGIARERVLMAPIKAAADLVIDTTQTTLAELRRRVLAEFGPEAGSTLTLTLMSFGFRYGLPREADIVFDARFLANPHYVETLRPLSGLDPAVRRYIEEDPAWSETLERLEALLMPLLPRYRAEGKNYLTIAVGCTGGKHRSVALIEELARRLRDRGWASAVVHRDLAREVWTTTDGGR
ncbi:MAG: RNase adapter RapZ [Geminicoccaceae bacterium]|nr:RNase adapter RapZ [Geminicoccaceae bacterium]MDW8123885.1 RNase adapter RapZ [Geminicoccaceae bacterium]